MIVTITLTTINIVLTLISIFIVVKLRQKQKQRDIETKERDKAFSQQLIDFRECTLKTVKGKVEYMLSKDELVFKVIQGIKEIEEFKAFLDDARYSGILVWNDEIIKE